MAFNNRQSVDQDLLEHVRLLKSFEDGNDGVSMFERLPTTTTTKIVSETILTPLPKRSKASTLPTVDAGTTESDDSARSPSTPGLSPSSSRTPISPSFTFTDSSLKPPLPNPIVIPAAFSSGQVPNSPKSPTFLVSPNSGSSQSTERARSTSPNPASRDLPPSPSTRSLPISPSPRTSSLVPSQPASPSSMTRAIDTLPNSGSSARSVPAPDTKPRSRGLTSGGQGDVPVSGPETAVIRENILEGSTTLTHNESGGTTPSHLPEDKIDRSKIEPSPSFSSTSISHPPTARGISSSSPSNSSPLASSTSSTEGKATGSNSRKLKSSKPPPILPSPPLPMSVLNASITLSPPGSINSLGGTTVKSDASSTQQAAAAAVASTKAQNRLSASKSAQQAKKLALQIKELQLQQQDLLRAANLPTLPGSPFVLNGAGSLSVPPSPSPSGMQTPTYAAGPPPASPLPPIPRSAASNGAGFLTPNAAVGGSVFAQQQLEATRRQSRALEAELSLAEHELGLAVPKGGGSKSSSARSRGRSPSPAPRPSMDAREAEEEVAPLPSIRDREKEKDRTDKDSVASSSRRRQRSGSGSVKHVEPAPSTRPATAATTTTTSSSSSAAIPKAAKKVSTVPSAAIPAPVAAPASKVPPAPASTSTTTLAEPPRFVMRPPPPTKQLPPPPLFEPAAGQLPNPPAGHSSESIYAPKKKKSASSTNSNPKRGQLRVVNTGPAPIAVPGPSASKGASRSKGRAVEVEEDVQGSSGSTHSISEGENVLEIVVDGDGTPDEDRDPLSPAYSFDERLRALPSVHRPSFDVPRPPRARAGTKSSSSSSKKRAGASTTSKSSKSPKSQQNHTQVRGQASSRSGTRDSDRDRERTASTSARSQGSQAHTRRSRRSARSPSPSSDSDDQEVEEDDDDDEEDPDLEEDEDAEESNPYGGMDEPTTRTETSGTTATRTPGTSMDDDEMYDDLRSNEHVAVTTARILDTRRIIHARPHVRPLTTFATSSAAAAVAPSPAGPGVPPPIGSTISPGMFDPNTATADDTAAGAGTEAEGKMPANLPDWSEIERGGPTSLPIYQIQRDLDFSMRKLVNIQVFEQLLEDPLGRHRFRDYLVSCGAQTAELDMWLDLQNHAKLYQQFQANADAIYDIYMVQGSQHRVKLPGNVSREIDQVLRHKNLPKPDVAFHSTQQFLLERLYNSDFQSFVRHKIIEQAEVKLGKSNLGNTDGLGDCFCLTNPRLRDHPIVLASDGFTAVTGYSRSQIIGRNCRFLQGPGTAPESVQRIRDGLNDAEGCNELLLNYRRDGTPFFCLLCIIPLRDATGQLIYFIGGQTNVTSVFTENKNLSFLITGGDSTVERIRSDSTAQPNVSPAMQEYQRGMLASKTNKEASGSIRSAGSIHHAAGSLGYANPSAAFSDPYLSLSRDFGAMPPTGINALGTSARAGVASLGGTLGKLFKKPSVDASLALAAPSLSGGAAGTAPVAAMPSSQLLGGAESLLGMVPGLLGDQMSLFKDLYSKLVVIKKAKREIIFVTRDLLLHLGLPASSPKELYSSPLIHSDLLDCISSADKNSTKTVRNRIKNAIRDDEAISEVVSLKLSGGWGLFSGRTEHNLRTGSLHLTPLKERDGLCVAYVGVFGWTKSRGS